MDQSVQTVSPIVGLVLRTLNDTRCNRLAWVSEQSDQWLRRSMAIRIGTQRRNQRIKIEEDEVRMR
eukprot:3474390-Amphidinium_carterae.1